MKQEHDTGLGLAERLRTVWFQAEWKGVDSGDLVGAREAGWQAVADEVRRMIGGVADEIDAQFSGEKVSAFQVSEFVRQMAGKERK